MTHKKENAETTDNYGADHQFQPPPFHSVELFIDGLDFTYQFKIWNMDAHTMNIIIKEDSAIIARLKEGNRVNSKYYSGNRSNPMVELNTEISRITKADEGRFSGHYIVGLSVEGNPYTVTMH